MKVAILGWGSLIWDIRDLPIVGGWERGGPLLPIEFSRIPKNRRLTLVIDEEDGVDVYTRFAVSRQDDLDHAINDLQAREGTPNRDWIGFYDLASDRCSEWAMFSHPRACTRIKEWTNCHQFDAAIWTALAPNFCEKMEEPFSVEAALRYIDTLPEAERAVATEYITKAPEEVTTPFRKRLLAETTVEILGDARDLPDGLPLWRYMKLSTLLLLLEGTAFFPSVATLRSGDPLEGALDSDFHPWLMRKLRDLGGEEASNELDSWLLKHTTESQRKFQELNKQDGWFNTQFFSDLYIQELSKRRAVWCWFYSSIESAGMWSVYGHGGIAVGTTLGALKAALPANRKFQMARILYHDRRPHSIERLNPESRDGDARTHRPHVVKGREYEHEREVRIATPCSSWEKGALVRDINWSPLVRTIIISPLLPYEEAKAVELFLKKHNWTNQPEIRRSTILGNIAGEEESRASISERFRPLFDDYQEEPDLPSLMKEL